MVMVMVMVMVRVRVRVGLTIVCNSKLQVTGVTWCVPKSDEIRNLKFL